MAEPDVDPDRTPFLPRPRAVLRILLVVIAALLSLHLLTGAIAEFAGSPQWSLDLFRVFGFGNEMNIPTHFSATMWMAAAALCWLLARHARDAGHSAGSWLLMGWVSVVVSFDEAAALHENLSDPVRELTGASGLLFFAWTIPYALITLTLVALLGRHVLSLGGPVRRLIVIAAAMFLTGALGLEMIEGYVAEGIEGRARDTNLYRALYTVEETLEMTGVAVFLYALLLQLRRRGRGSPPSSEPGLDTREGPSSQARDRTRSTTRS